MSSKWKPSPTTLSFKFLSKISLSSKSTSSDASPGVTTGQNTPLADKEEMLRSNFVNEELLKPLNSCDALFIECEEFLNMATKTVDFTKKKGNTKMSKLVPGKINKWRAKRKGNDLFDGFDALQSRMDEADKMLKTLSNSSTSNTSALISQSLYLNARLTACAEFNRKEIGRLKPALLAGRAYFCGLQKYEEGLISMVDFLDEVVELKRNEPVPYVPWAMRQQMEEELRLELLEAKGDDTVEVRRESLDRRINKVQKVMVGVKKAMEATDKEHARCLNLFTHCLRSQLALLNFLHRCQSGIIIASTTGVSLAHMVPAGYQSSTNAGGASPNQNGLVSMSNPINISFNHGAAPAPASSQGTGENNTSRTSDVGEELSKLSFSYNHGAMAAQLRTGRPSDKKVRRKGEGAKEQSLSFDVDSDEEDEEEADTDEEEEGEDHVLVGGDYEQARTIEKSVRHMSKALIGLQRNSGLGLGMDGVEPYDHRGCSDCTGSYDMANDCCMHMAASNMRAKQCTDRLLKLAVYREKMLEMSTELDSLDWGSQQNST
ncbi:hypothetical protein B484DRAFT_444152 [Ochromonadaceae sp. CCMP2298]|nr:hypothetical protein B484DRAFT_444152 [Ochromonadaceae sp. CCMP2298]|mmetsp:Transcript_10369/g.22979  ORF Transcript_10369/g.22979 Transcript_10369/m.22979 type:complete len:546 (+) Transcript_10369:112-1749(+)